MSNYQPGLCHLNGRILPLGDARIDPRDRGFLFGDALYEGFKVIGGSVLHLEEHLARLRSGLAFLRIPEPWDLPGRCRELVDACGLETGFLYLQVTRGAGPRTRTPPLDLEPTVFLEATPRTYEPGATGVRRVVTMPDPRRRHCDIKSTSLVATVTGKLRAVDAGVDEVLFVGEGDRIREGGNTNFFARRGEVLETHPLDGRILPGVTRGLVLALARCMERQGGVRIAERAPRLGERREWSEAFLTGTITGLQPVVELDGEPIGDGATGHWTRALGAALDDLDARRAAAAGPESP
jgi:D-alanine transaminase